MPAAANVSATLRPRLRPCDRKQILAAMNGKSILVQCNRPDLKTSYAYFSMHDRALQIIYLNVQSGGVMIPIHSEDLLFSEYPEARLLHDGNAWNVGELSCWLKFAETETEERDS